jgi:hypothetical protein
VAKITGTQNFLIEIIWQHAPLGWRFEGARFPCGFDLNRGDQPVSPLRDGLDYNRSLCVISQGSPQQGHGIGDDIVTYVHAAPDGLTMNSFVHWFIASCNRYARRSLPLWG